MPDTYRRLLSLLVAVFATAAVASGIEAASQKPIVEVSHMSKKNPIVECGVNVDGVEWFGTVDENEGTVAVKKNGDSFGTLGKWEDDEVGGVKGLPENVQKALSEGLAAQARAQ